MIAMDVQLDEKSTKFLTEQAKLFPNEVRRAFYYSCGITLRIMRGRMTGKSKHIAQWSDFTKRYRAMSTYGGPNMFGGMLMWPDGKQLTMQPEGDRVRIGWLGHMEPAARKFQEASSKETAPGWRRAMYAMGFLEDEVPRVAVTPERPVVAQAQEDAASHVADWTLGAFVKILQKRIAQWEVRYHKSRATRDGARAASNAADAYNSLGRVYLSGRDAWL